ncbi:unnamed protein product, partial [Laminaria digitata]
TRAKVDPLLPPPVPPVISATAGSFRSSQPFGGETRPAVPGAISHKMSPAESTGYSGAVIAKGLEDKNGSISQVVGAKQQRHRQNNNSPRKRKGADSQKVSPALSTGYSGGVVAKRPTDGNSSTPQVVVDAKQQRPRQSNNSLRKQKQKQKQKRQQQQREGNALLEATTSTAAAAAGVDLRSKAPPAGRVPQGVGALGGRGTVAAARGKFGVGSNDKVCPAAVDVDKEGRSVTGCEDDVGKVLPVNAQQSPPPPHQQHQYLQTQPQPQQQQKQQKQCQHLQSQHQHQLQHHYPRQYQRHQQHQQQHQQNQHQHNDDPNQGETPRKEAVSVQHPGAHSLTPSTTTTTPATTTSSSVYDPATNKPNNGRKNSSGGVDKRQEGLLETVDVSGDIAEWAVDNSRGGEFTAMLDT